MAERSSAAARDDAEVQQAYRTVADTLEQAVRDTLSSHEPEASRLAVRRLTAIDAEFGSSQAPPGWTLAFLVLADWIDAARTALEDQPDRVERGPGVDAGRTCGGRYRSRAGYTIKPLQGREGAQETSHYIDALGDDFLASMIGRWPRSAHCTATATPAGRALHDAAG